MSSLIRLENVDKIYQLGGNQPSKSNLSPLSRGLTAGSRFIKKISFLNLDPAVKPRDDELSYTALKNINLTINHGEMTAIVGASGSGKSTLMNLIGFLDRPSKGRYFFNDQDVSLFKEDELATIRNQKIGFIFQSFFLLARSNALQNVMLPLFYRGTPQDEAIAKSLSMLEKVGVAHLAHHKPNQLSGGQQQRVAIARALVTNPDVILADEPTGALDSQTGHEVMELLTKLNREEKRTIVIITHDKEISRRCSRTVILRDGQLQPESIP